jgi:tRNA (guanine37-N1)-methyltransferase
MAERYAAGPGLIVFCGRFEGLDQRVIEARGMEEVCVGDAVLMGGEAAALVILEATLRLLPGVLGNAASAESESFATGLLEHPQYTKPRVWEGREIPEVLLSGDHAAVARWQEAEAKARTKAVRPKWKPD